MNTISFTRRSLSIGALVAILAVTLLSLSSVLASPVNAGHQSSAGDDKGFTGGWYDGRTVDFFYNKDFFCKEPPESEANSDCIVGEEPQTAPRGGKIPVLYVMTPLGFTPEERLQCPDAGDCINHPSDIDTTPINSVLDSVFGTDVPNVIALPPHSHIVDVDQGGWWEIEVIGVTDELVWNQIAAAKDLDKVRDLQEAGVGITGDIPSNLYLFFDVRD
ncbi:MAG: hypothetical protein ABIZ57_11955 [Candidatus Limnocylindria bacterium]